MNRILRLQKNFSRLPFGRQLFSHFVARQAPYFLTITPRIEELRPNFMATSIRKTRKVENHIKTVHAIAMCNLCEFTAGICMETSIPKHRRWIPIGMQVSYLKKAKTNLRATCDLEKVEWNNCSEVDCFVSVKDTAGIEVMTANIQMKVSAKKKH